MFLKLKTIILVGYARFKLIFFIEVDFFLFLIYFSILFSSFNIKFIEELSFVMYF